LSRAGTHRCLPSRYSRPDNSSRATRVATIEKMTGTALPHTLQRATVPTSFPHGRGGKPYGVFRSVAGLQPR
jgi:hypothetical protein